MLLCMLVCIYACVYGWVWVCFVYMGYFVMLWGGGGTVVSVYSFCIFMLCFSMIFWNKIFLYNNTAICIAEVTEVT